ncbi:MAG: FMN-binding protein [Planctomycetes bacterium]|nr:FMN-binding protein [Planctomycetota bacterium]
MPTRSNSSPNSRGAAVRRNRGARFLTHAARIAIVASAFFLLRDASFAPERIGIPPAVAARPIMRRTLVRIQRVLPTARSVSSEDADGRCAVLDASRRTIGYAIETSPPSDSIIGFSGPTNTLLVFDTRMRVVGVDLLESGDTPDHVRRVAENTAFLTALVGRSWEEAADPTGVDAVTGATLTSLAILEGIANRLGGPVPSLRFPNPLGVDEARGFFPTASALRPRADRPAIHEVIDTRGQHVGSLVRSAPACDGESGYQGPTEALIAVGVDGRVIGVRVRASYDNEPYVDYVREDSRFLNTFRGMTLEELAEYDAEAARIEGVSGATMTSQAVARGLPLAARDALRARAPRSAAWTWRDSGTLAVIGFGVSLALFRIGRSRAARIAASLAMIVYFGFFFGDLLSLAQFAGWARNGVPWRIAPGMILLAAVAVLGPSLANQPVYCRAICPYGAAQRLVRGRRWRFRPPIGVSRVLRAAPACLLVAASGWTLVGSPSELGVWEPFGVFPFKCAAFGAAVFAAIGLVASRFVPMAYCRFGCPTGALLEYVRYRKGHWRPGPRDGAALAVLSAALVARYLAGDL